MSDIRDDVVATMNAVTALTAQVTALTAAVAALTVPDLSGINAKLDTLLADLEPTPQA